MRIQKLQTPFLANIYGTIRNLIKSNRALHVYSNPLSTKLRRSATCPSVKIHVFFPLLMSKRYTVVANMQGTHIGLAVSLAGFSVFSSEYSVG